MQDYHHSILAVMKAKQISKAELSRRLGIKPQSVTTLLNNPTVTKLSKIAEALDVSVCELFTPVETVVSTSTDFCALVRCGGELYSASTPKELRELAERLCPDA